MQFDRPQHAASAVRSAPSVSRACSAARQSPMRAATGSWRDPALCASEDDDHHASNAVRDLRLHPRK